jgi:HAE1 family hydrophobic/amphiphilic exporter-1
MLAASFLAIFFIPVSFDVVERFGNWIGGKKHQPRPVVAGTPALGEGHD